MPTGVVQEIGTTQKGAPFAVVDGTRYYAGRCDITGMSPGMRIEYVSSPFGSAGRDGKHPQGLQKWRPIVDAQGKVETASTITEADILRSVSNVVGSACAAGSIKAPGELALWFRAAYRGFTGLQEDDGPDPMEDQGEEDLDDKIPF